MRIILNVTDLELADDALLVAKDHIKRGFTSCGWSVSGKQYYSTTTKTGVSVRGEDVDSPATKGE